MYKGKKAGDSEELAGFFDGLMSQGLQEQQGGLSEPGLGANRTTL